MISSYDILSAEVQIEPHYLARLVQATIEPPEPGEALLSGANAIGCPP
jgi:hypothetical protein